jgi:outer membrane lipoprotein SlyB
MRTLSSGLLIVSLIIAGCESKTGTGALVGAGIGVGAGALIGGGSGALIGGAVGAAGGALIGYSLSQEDQEKLHRSSPQTARRIDNGEQLSIKDIEKMSNAGISEDKIIGVIDSTGSVYHLSSRNITELQQAGVSQRVIDYMLQTGY